MAHRSPEEIAAVLRDIAALLQLSGENRFRAAAYERGADAVVALGDGLDRVIEQGALEDTPGIGKTLAAQIPLLRRGEPSDVLEKLEASFPAGATRLSRGGFLSRSAIQTLSDAGITTLDEVREWASAGRLRELKGFTERTEARILAQMEAAESRRGRMRLVDARDLAVAVTRFLGDAADDVVLVGEGRRGIEEVAQVDLLAVTQEPARVKERFLAYPARRVAERGEHVTVELPDGARIRLEACTPKSRAAALQRLTGPAEHNAEIDRIAKSRGITIDLTGIRRVTGEEVALRTEEELYALIGLAYVPPLRREGAPELEAAARGALPPAVDLRDVRGVVHCHTTYSDGRDSVLAMVREAEARGFSYITITDHSPTASYARGVEPERLKQQWEEIARVQESVKVKILRGTESDILKDGALDYDDSILEQLDVVIASVHNRYRLEKKEMTLRLVRAMRHPAFKIWGHGLGRILCKRPAIDCDVEAVLEAAAASRAAIEINGDPNRLDLEPRYCKRAKELGLKFVLSVDAHATEQMDYLALAVTMAERAGLAPGDVLNTRDAQGFAAAVRPVS